MRTATIYNFLLEANIMASMAILLMILLRKFLRKPLGNGPICFGWLMVALRLLCPLTLPNPLIGEIRPVMIRDGAIRPIAAQLKVRTGDAMGELYHFTRRTVGMAEESAVATGVRNAYLGMYNGNFSRFLMKIYLLVLMLLVVWMVIANVHFLVKMKKRRIEPLTGELKDVYRGICGRLHRRMLPVYYVDPLESPCLVGVFRPYIALPLTAKPEDVPLMLEHEMRHYKGWDHIWAPVRLVCCCVHWFNPLVWIAAHMSRRDTELKCDERVTAAMTEAERKEYAAMLVQQTTKRSVAGMQVMATGMSFTGKRLKERVKLVIGGKRAIKALSVVFMVLCCMLLVGSFATAEYSGRVVIPAFREGMLPAAQPVTTDEEAIALAGRIAALPQLQADTKDGQWSVRKENGNPGVKAVAWVNDNGEKTYHIRLYENGGIYGTVNSEKSYYSDDRLFINQQEPWQDDLADFIEQWILAMDPALEGKIEHAEYRYQFLLDGERYAYYEVPTDMEGAVYYYVTVKISPEFQIIECSPGNG